MSTYGFKADNPGAIDFTLTVTLPLHRWQRLASTLSIASVPEARSEIDLMWGAIRSMVRQAEARFEPEENGT